MRVMPEVGAPIGERYTLVGPLGEGGLGTVWEAEDAALRRRVAIKLARADTPLNAEHLARIEREAQLVAQMDHANIVRVYDYGVDAGYGPFIAMELLRGHSLEDELEIHGTIRLKEIVAWLGPVADALDVLHARGVVHRDVKPPNMMRIEKRGGAVVKLLDFGIAAFLDGHERLTSQGCIVGTPEYMAPEVVEGALATAQSDVYALAVVAYEALSGALPHDGGSPMEILRAKATRPAHALSESTGRMFSLPLEEAFARALARDPRRRCRSAGELVDLLRGCIRGRP
ncbi:MAG: serine/threonine-protein kinase [Sandaracinaceae bacterium]|mgnify:FL=1